MNAPNNKKTALVFASRNMGKASEVAHFFKGLPLKLESLGSFPEIGPISEDGRTFADNALKKARTVHCVTGGFVLADDSGLECEDLMGGPGVDSARFAGPNATDEENNKKLVETLLSVHDPSRRARYVCVMALVDPDGNETLVEETCDGVIIFMPGGTGGFGYDPYFFLPEKNCTMAELSLEKKNLISHRGKALKKIRMILEEKLS